MYEKAHYFSPIGCLEISGSKLGIRAIKIIKTKDCLDIPTPDILIDCVQQLEEYFDGVRIEFDVKLDLSGATSFLKSVWKEVLKIPYGHTASYSSIAKKIGSPKSSRAVGMANRQNPIPIIIPCHRVIAKDGDLQGYYYGLDVKRTLLQLENPKDFGKQGQLF